MFAYFAGLFLERRLPIIGLAALVDEQGGWRPERFGREELGCDNRFRFPMVKRTQPRLPPVPCCRPS